MLSEKFIKSQTENSSFPLSKMDTLLKVRGIEAKIEELNSTLNYLRTQIHQPNSNIIQTIEQRIEILQQEMEYFYIIDNGKI